MNNLKENLNEREFELVNIVGAQLAANQRELSRQMNLSLGMTNMLLRRLVTKGYIRIKQLDSHKVRYILTPKGFSEKMRKSIKYTLKTIDSIGLIKKKVSTILDQLYHQGYRKFYVLGVSDLALLIKMILMEKFDNKYEFCQISLIDEASEDGVILMCTEETTLLSNSKRTYINLIEELAKQEELVER